MQTNKPLQLTTAPSILQPDLEIWYEFSAAVANFYCQDVSNLKWFEIPWLFVECLMYRLIQGAIEERYNIKKKNKQIFLQFSHSSFFITFTLAFA